MREYRKPNMILPISLHDGRLNLIEIDYFEEMRYTWGKLSFQGDTLLKTE